MTESTQLDGQLGYGTAQPLTVKAPGTVTWLPAPGAVIRRGQAVARVDDRPVVLLFGDVPQYRTIGLGGTSTPGNGSTPSAAGTAPGSDGSTSARSSRSIGPTVTSSPAATSRQTTEQKGSDVRELERNLWELGLRGFTVDDTFTASTADAVRRWQRSLAVPATGQVTEGDVIFLPGPVRVADVSGRPGQETPGDLLSVTGLERMVTTQLPVSDSAWASPGAAVSIILPGGRTVPGKVRSVGTTAQAANSADQGGSGGDGGPGGGPATATVTVTIAPDNQGALGAVTAGATTVSHVTASRPDVLCVPLAALVALAEGGYGLEIVDDPRSGRSHDVAVTPGMSADGFVEVSGPVHVGQVVRMPQ